MVLTSCVASGIRLLLSGPKMNSSFESSADLRIKENQKASLGKDSGQCLALVSSVSDKEAESSQAQRARAYNLSYLVNQGKKITRLRLVWTI